MTGFLVLFMQVGFAFLVTGLTRAKNAGHMMMMNIAAFAVALLAYYAVGFAFQFGGIAPIANLGGTPADRALRARQRGRHRPARLLPAERPRLRRRRDGAVPVPGRVHGDGRLHHHRRDRRADLVRRVPRSPRSRWARSSTRSTASGSGAAAGWRTSASLHWGHGAVDFAGSGVVHATGGWAALALAMVLGPRIGKFNKDGSPNAIPGHNIPFVVIGTLILVFGWMGFNPGSTLGATDLRIGLVAVNTLLAACVGFVMAMACTNAKYGKPDISMSCNGMLAGLVAITAPCAFVAPWAASIIGVVAGLARRATASCSSTTSPRRRPVRRDLGARRVRRVGRARGRPLRRRHLRRRLERRQRAT